MGQAGVRIPAGGSGKFVVTAPLGRTADHVAGAGDLTYTVEIEEGLPFATAVTARTIDRILDDERGWPTVAGRTFHQVADAGELRILLATPDTTDELCAPLRTNGEVSCRNGDLVVLNAGGGRSAPTTIRMRCRCTGPIWSTTRSGTPSGTPMPTVLARARGRR
jgi:hypothetical protein